MKNETSAKVAFAAKARRFEAKNRKSNDVYTEYKRRSFYDFAAETADLQQKWTFAEVSNHAPESWGKIQVFTGNGRGKTTAALGTAVRALAKGKRVAIVYFDKGGAHYSERGFLDWLKDQDYPSGGTIDYVAAGLDRIDPKTGRFRLGVLPEDRSEAERGLTAAAKIIQSGEYDLVVLDEINVTVALGMLAVDPVEEMLKSKPKNLEVICTGRNAPAEIVRLADLVTDMAAVRHYLDQGVPAREGLDY